MDIQSIPTRYVLIFSGLLGLFVRTLFWRDYGTMSWDGGNHVNGGLFLARLLSNLDSPLLYASDVSQHYSNAIGALFFYPYAYDVLSAISILIFGANELAARLPNMIFSVAIFIPIYLLAKELYDERVGSVAAILASLSPYFIQWGGRVLVDVPFVFFLTLSLYFTARIGDSDTNYDWIGLVISIGIASQFKPVALYAGPVLWGYILINRARVARTLRFWVSGLVALGIASAYLASGPLVSTLLPGYGWVSESTLRWVTSAPTTGSGGPHDPAIPNPEAFLVYIRLLLPQLSAPVLGLSIIGITYTLRRRTNSLRAQEALLISFIIWTYTIFTIIPNKDWRYTMPMMAPLIVFASYAIIRLNHQLDGRRANVALALLVLVAGVGSIGETYDGAPYTTPDSGIQAAADEIDSSSGSIVYVHNQTNWVSAEALTFYLFGADRNLEHSVKTNSPEKADWLVSSNSYQDSDWKLYNKYGDEKTTFLYKRV